MDYSKNGATESHDLPPDVTARIDEHYARIEVDNYYALLGIERHATRAEIRSAFLRVAPLFHPDRYYMRRLGEYREKMLRVFAALGLARDTLENDATRADYDCRLGPSTMPKVAAAVPSTLPDIRAAAPATDPPGAGASSPPSRAASERPSVSTRASSPADLERARQQLAARLGGTSRMRSISPPQSVHPNPLERTPTGAHPAMRPPSGAHVTARPPSGTSGHAIDSKTALEALKRRYEETKAHALTSQSAQHVKAAHDAEARGDFVEAARLYRIATTRTSDATLKAASVHAELRAKQQLLEQATARAKDAEAKQDWPEAGGAWARVFEVAPSADAAHRAAVALLRAGQDPRRAARYGEEAVKLEPNRAGLPAHAGAHLRRGRPASPCPR